MDSAFLESAEDLVVGFFFVSGAALSGRPQWLLFFPWLTLEMCI